jgi:Zinc finger, ZZ type
MELVHLWNRCHACGMQPIAGQRFTCETCPAGPDNDLCASCHRAGKHAPGHQFSAHEGAPADAYLRWLAVPRVEAAAPRVPDRFVVRPEFRCGSESFFGAYAFVVVTSDGPLVLTALHVMDELLKTRGIDVAALPHVVDEVGLYDLFAPNWIFAELGKAASMLVLPEARLGDEEPYSDRDIAAFRADPTVNVTPGQLAAEQPRVGDPLWLAFHRRASTNRTIGAVVVESTERTLVFRFLDPAEQAPYSSGAPLLDRHGRVAGINAGAGSFEGQRFGHANHVTSIRRHLALTPAAH